MLGWTVLNQLKLDPTLRHIPVQIVTSEEERQHGLAHGAFSYVIKAPTSDSLENALTRIKDFSIPRRKRLLIVEDNDIERQSITELLHHKDIELVSGRIRSGSVGGHAGACLRLRGPGPEPARHDGL